MFTWEDARNDEAQRHRGVKRTEQSAGGAKASCDDRKQIMGINENYQRPITNIGVIIIRS